MKDAPINLPPRAVFWTFLKPPSGDKSQDLDMFTDAAQDYARAAVLANRAGRGELTRSQRMREAGFTARDKRLTCDECGAKFTAQFAPLHECATAAPAEPHPADASHIWRPSAADAELSYWLKNVKPAAPVQDEWNPNMGAFEEMKERRAAPVQQEPVAEICHCDDPGHDADNHVIWIRDPKKLPDGAMLYTHPDAALGQGEKK